MAPTVPCRLGPADLRYRGTHHELVVLHDDKDFATAARYLPDLRERVIHDVPQAESTEEDP
jgi:hypothetical protein